MKNEKENFVEKLKSHMLDIMVGLLIIGVGFMIFQSKKHEKTNIVKSEIIKNIKQNVR